MTEQYALLRHFLAALAYRTQKALGGAPETFGDFRFEQGVRTPHELVHHMQNVLGHAKTFFVGGTFRPAMRSTLEDQATEFHAMLKSLAEQLEAGAPMHGTTPERLLQGPLSDAMTHAGQLALLRRLAGAPIPPESFIEADINPDHLGTMQPDPVAPDMEWREPEEEAR